MLSDEIFDNSSYLKHQSQASTHNRSEVRTKRSKILRNGILFLPHKLNI